MDTVTANILFDGRCYWLNDMGTGEHRVATRNGVVEFDELRPEKAEVVNMISYRLNFSHEIIILKNEDNLYAVFSLFVDSMGYGGIYLSVEGFVYRSVYEYSVKHFDGYATTFYIAEDQYKNWGVKRMSKKGTLYYPFVSWEEIRLPETIRNLEEMSSFLTRTKLIPDGSVDIKDFKDLTISKLESRRSSIGFMPEKQLGR